MDAELIQYIEGSLRTHDEKLLFGWEYAGNLGFNIMLNNTIAFNGFILASPFSIWDQIEALYSISTIHTMLYFTSRGPDECIMVPINLIPGLPVKKSVG